VVLGGFSQRRVASPSTNGASIFFITGLAHLELRRREIRI